MRLRSLSLLVLSTGLGTLVASGGCGGDSSGDNTGGNGGSAGSSSGGHAGGSGGSGGGGGSSSSGGGGGSSSSTGGGGGSSSSGGGGGSSVAGSGGGGATGGGGPSGGAGGASAGAGGANAGAGGGAAGAAAGAGGTVDTHGDTAQFHFEADIQGWKEGHFESMPAPPGVALAQGDEHFAGLHSLKVDIDTTGDSAAAVVAHDKWNRAIVVGSAANIPLGKAVKFHVWIPNDPKITMVQMIDGCFAGGAIGYKFDAANLPNTRGSWVEGTFTTVAKPPCQNTLAELGVQFYTATGGTKFTAYIDAVGW